MKTSLLIKEIKGVFKSPKKKYYFGKIRYGTPYFDPINYVDSIIWVRKLVPRSPEEIAKKDELYKHNKNTPDHLYSNYPMVRRAKNKIVKIFGTAYYVTWGWPISARKVELGWKDKWESPRFEWAPQFTILFFGLQFCIHWVAPIVNGEKYPDNDKYYEMILMYLKYSGKDIKIAERDWGWVDSDTKKSTWNKNYLI